MTFSAVASVLLSLTGALLSPAGVLSVDAPAIDTVTTDQELVERAQGARVLGSGIESAAITIYEFFDYSCSTCQAFHAQRGDSLRSLAGPDLSLRFHHYIIPRLPRGYAAAEAAACAAGLGGTDAFLSYHDRLLREVDTWRGAVGPEPFERWALEAGLPTEAFTDCLARDVPAQLIMADARLAATFAVQGTPTFVVLPRGAASAAEGVVFYGNEPMQRFHEAIAEVRSRAR